MITAIIAQLVYLNRNPGSDDYTFDSWPMVLSSQSVQSLSIITACIPYLKPFLASLETGMIRADDLRRRGITGTGVQYTASIPSSGQKSIALRIFRPGQQSQLSERNDNAMGQGQSQPVVHGGDEHTRHAEWDAESQASRSRIIMHTTTWAVESESQEGHDRELSV